MGWCCIGQPPLRCSIRPASGLPSNGNSRLTCWPLVSSAPTGGGRPVGIDLDLVLICKNAPNPSGSGCAASPPVPCRWRRIYWCTASANGALCPSGTRAWPEPCKRSPAGARMDELRADLQQPPATETRWITRRLSGLQGCQAMRSRLRGKRAECMP